MPIIQVAIPKRGYLKAKRERLQREQEQQKQQKKTPPPSEDQHKLGAAAAVHHHTNDDEADISFAFEGHNRFLKAKNKKVASVKSSTQNRSAITIDQTALLEQERREHQQIERDLLRRLALEKQAREDVEVKLKELQQQANANAELAKTKELEEAQTNAFHASLKQVEHDAEVSKEQALAEQREQYDAVVTDLQAKVSSYQMALQNEREKQAAMQEEWKNKVEAMQNKQAEASAQREEVLLHTHQVELEKQKQLQAALEEEYRRLTEKLQQKHEQDTGELRVDCAKEMLALQCLLEQEFNYRQESERERDSLTQQLESLTQQQEERKERKEHQMGQLRTELQTLQQNVANQDEMRRSLESTRNELEVCQQRLIREESQFQDSMQTLEEEADKLETALQTKTTQLHELKMELETVKGELKESKAHLVEHESSKAKMKNKLQSLREQLSLAKQELSRHTNADAMGNEKKAMPSKPHTPSVQLSTTQSSRRQASDMTPGDKIFSHRCNTLLNSTRETEQRREDQTKSQPLDTPAVSKNPRHRSKRKRETPHKSKTNVASDCLLTMFLSDTAETMTASNKRRRKASPQPVTASKQKAKKPNSVMSNLVAAPLKLFERGVKNRVTSESP